MTPPLTPAETLAALALWLILTPIIFAFVLQAPKMVVFGFLGVILLFSDSTWGQLQAQGTLYSRGSGVFYFSLLNLVLFVAGIAAIVKRLANPQNPRLAVPLSKSFAAFGFLLFAHTVVGLMLGVELHVILGYRGIINVLNMLIFMYLVVMAFQDEKDLKQLLQIILVLAAMRAVFGLVRYMWFGGDSANPYANFEGMDVKILFFDIGDNFVASLGAFCAAWLLTAREIKLSFVKRVFLWMFLALEIAAVALSFRRSSLIGLALMFVFLFFRIPMRKKLQVSILATIFLSVIAVVFFEHRLRFADADGGGILNALIYDIAPGKGGIKDNRFYELYAAAQSLGSNWLFGLGSWGTFSGDRELLAYHGDDFSFVHSGFGHMILKTGLVGCLLFVGILGAYVLHYMRHRHLLHGLPRLAADAGFAGFLFWLPTLLVGTPIIEIRTMLLLGLTLALPFVAIGWQNYQARSYYYYAAA